MLAQTLTGGLLVKESFVNKVNNVCLISKVKHLIKMQYSVTDRIKIKFNVEKRVIVHFPRPRDISRGITIYRPYIARIGLTTLPFSKYHSTGN